MPCFLENELYSVLVFSFIYQSVSFRGFLLLLLFSFSGESLHFYLVILTWLQSTISSTKCRPNITIYGGTMIKSGLTKISFQFPMQKSIPCYNHTEEYTQCLRRHEPVYYSYKSTKVWSNEAASHDLCYLEGGAFLSKAIDFYWCPYHIRIPLSN